MEREESCSDADALSTLEAGYKEAATFDGGLEQIEITSL